MLKKKNQIFWPRVKGSGYAVQGILLALFGLMSPLQGGQSKSIQRNSNWSPLTYYERFYPEGSVFFQSDNTPIHRAWKVTR